MPLRALTFVTLAVAIMVCVGAPAASAQAPSTCPSFKVLHDDRVGRAILPAGDYNITTNGITCSQASERFTNFLEDWDGKLPGGWKTATTGAGNATFSRSGQSFTVTKGTPSGGGGGQSRGLACTFAVSVPVRDHIGSFVIPKGRYRIVRLSPHSPSCARSNALFGSFLLDFDGVLSGGYVLIPGEGAFVTGSLWNGFRIEPFTGTPSGNTPARTGVTRCPNRFTVQHNDRIGSLRFPKGGYYLSLRKGSKGLSCSQASSQFTRFLSSPNGNLPSPWVIDPRIGGFRRGRGSATGFVAKPAFAVR